MNKSLTRTALSGAGTMLVGTGFQSFVGFVVLAVLARLITPADFGLVAAALVVISFSQLFSQLGVGQALVQRAEITEAHRKVGFTCSILLGLIVAAIIVFAAPAIAVFFRMPDLVLVLRVLAVVFPLQSVSMVAECLLQRDLRFGRMVALNAVAQTLGYGLVGVSCALLGLGVWALVAAEIGRVAVRMTLALILERDSFGISLARRELRDIWAFGAGFSFVRLSNYFSLQADNLVVGRVGTPIELGVYSKAYQIVMIPALLLGTVADRVLFPVLSSIQQDKMRVSKGFLRSLGIATLLSIPVSALSIVFGDVIIDIVLGGGWDDAVVPFQILSLAIVFRSGYKVCDSLVRSLGEVYAHAKNHSILAISVLTFSAVGIRWGLPGVAVGVLIAITINYLLMLRLCSKLLNIPSILYEIYLRHLLWFFIVLILSIVTRVLSGNLPDLIGFSLSGLLVLLVYGITILYRPKGFGAEGQWVSEILKKSIRRTSQT